MQFISFRYDGTQFLHSMDSAVKYRKRRGKTPRKIRFFFYCSWAAALLKAEIGPQNAQYTFPAPLLNYLRHICPGDVKGEMRDDAYNVTIEQFCRVTDMPVL